MEHQSKPIPCLSLMEGILRSHRAAVAQLAVAREVDVDQGSDVPDVKELIKTQFLAQLLHGTALVPGPESELLQESASLIGKMFARGDVAAAIEFMAERGPQIQAAVQHVGAKQRQMEDAVRRAEHELLPIGFDELSWISRIPQDMAPRVWKNAVMGLLHRRSTVSEVEHLAQLLLEGLPQLKIADVHHYTNDIEVRHIQNWLHVHGRGFADNEHHDPERSIQQKLASALSLLQEHGYLVSAPAVAVAG